LTAISTASRPQPTQEHLTRPRSRRTITVEDTIVEVSNKPSPTGERIVAKPYPKDNEPRTFAVSQDWFEAVAEHNKLRNLGREDLLFSRDSRHAELPQHLPHPGLADSSVAVHVAPSDSNPNPADEHERASEGAERDPREAAGGQVAEDASQPASSRTVHPVTWNLAAHAKTKTVCSTQPQVWGPCPPACGWS
jgi:hypothetical protein